MNITVVHTYKIGLSIADSIAYKWLYEKCWLFLKLQVIPMLNHPNDRVGAEVLSFLSVFMYDGNKVVQVMLSLVICASGYLLQLWQQCPGFQLIRNFLVRQTITACDTIWLEILAIQTFGYSPPNRQDKCWQRMISQCIYTVNVHIIDRSLTGCTPRVAVLSLSHE